MNKLLPKTKNNQKGFTLVELLVVIVIISVLAVTGFAVFSGLTTRGNDSRRVADIKAIADVHENKRTAAMADYAGIVLAATDFAGGTIPVDPVAGRQYCIRYDSAPIDNVAVADIGIGLCGGLWDAVSTAPIGGSVTHFKVCVLLTGNTAADIRCVGSKQ